MTEQYQPQGSVETNRKPDREKTPTELRADFREQWQESYRGEFPIAPEGKAQADATHKVEAYEVFFDPYSCGERSHYLSGFGLHAIRAGFEIAEAVSFTMPVVSVTVKDGEKPDPRSIPLESEASERTFVTYFLKSPLEGQATTVPQPTSQQQ